MSIGNKLADKLMDGMDWLGDRMGRAARNSRKRKRNRVQRRIYRQDLNSDSDLRKARAAFDGAVALQEDVRWVECRNWPFFWEASDKTVRGWTARCMSSDRVVYDPDTEVKYGPPAGWGKTRLEAVQDLNNKVEEFMG